ncbi:transcriptional regulator with XRE-family HTH domain [Filimonas zeae]|uniref:HTH cro/C1-type domain-containing protein n=1 Tax=Filimonas zeae TaxID=1737353 RepID=A0A917IPL8_9BACT|nr:helix-turn-helix transcriptional regulator [Filimonas zeae]MDR6337651.1 transcriptional regulator with XRE-family HTH domain [Filimonas zeae]GGH59637.1 hypothetical protein GCM10011379_06630 [Filimonas zeae]
MPDSHYLKEKQVLLGRRIGILRVKAGFKTKREVDVLFSGPDTKSSVISRLEKGVSVELRTIVRLANIFKMPVYCFFDFEGKFRVSISEKYSYDLEQRLASVKKMLGKNIVKARTEKGWSQLDLEVASGVDKATIGYFERGSENIKFNSIVIIAEALGINIWQLFKA